MVGRLRPLRADQFHPRPHYSLTVVGKKMNRTDLRDEDITPVHKAQASQTDRRSPCRELYPENLNAKHRLTKVDPARDTLDIDGINRRATNYHGYRMPARQALLKLTNKRFDASPYLKKPASPFHVTAHGALFAEDCMKILPLLKDHTVDTVFADPPFNLGKEYGRKTNDDLPDDCYLEWCRGWLSECVRILKPGGSLFLYNLPKWNVLLGRS